MLNIFKKIIYNQNVTLLSSKRDKIGNQLWKHLSTQSASRNVFASQYCVDIVKKNDYENYLCTLLLPGDKRRFAFAVRAFNVEIAKIGGSVSEAAIGKMRLQFWRDSIDKCYDKNEVSYVSDHPVLRELKYTLDNNKVSKLYLKRLINARDRSPKKPFLTVNELEDYAEQTVSSLYYILLEIWNVKNVNIDHAVSHLGKAQGVTNLLRSIPYSKRDTSVTIPQEILIKHGVSDERIIRDVENDKGVEECVFEIATVAHQHLEKARNLSKSIPKSIRPLLLPAVAVDRYLDRLRKNNFRLSNQELLRRDQLLPLSYYWYKIRSKY